jgi:hypothetical protein
VEWVLGVTLRGTRYWVSKSIEQRANNKESEGRSQETEDRRREQGERYT